MKLQTPQELAMMEHPAADTTNRFALDCLFRQCGYRIQRREKNKEPVWFKGGVEFSQREVVGRMDPERLKTAEIMQRVYYQIVDGEK